MIEYYFLYFALFIAGIFLFHSGYTDNRKLIYSILFFLSTALFECLRDVTVGEDTINYVNWFNDFCVDGWKESFINPRRYVEPGYKILNLLISEFTSNEHVLISVVAIIILFLLIKYLYSQSEDLFLSSLLFMGLNFFINSMTAFRQFIAMSIVIWIVPSLLEHKWNKVFFISLFAFIFHKSSIMFVIVVIISYFFRDSKNLKWLLLCEVIISLIPSTVLSIFLNFVPKYSIYITSGEKAEIGKLRFLIIVIELFMMLYYYWFRKDLFSEKNNIIFSIVSISALIGVLSSSIPHIFRLGYYFDFFLLLFIPLLLPRKNKLFWKFIVILFSIMLFSYYLFTNAGGVVPYKIF